MSGPVRIAHIVNPVRVGPEHGSYLHVAQPVTFESLVRAQARAEEHGIQVELCTAQYPEDRSVIPPGFTVTPDLETSVHDHLQLADQSRKLPRLHDILERLYETTTAEVLVYSNADIGVRPRFYQFVHEQIQSGVDAFCINRRDLPKERSGTVLDVTQMEQIYQTRGQAHPGTDCFVFRRELWPRLELRHVFLGYPPVGKVLRRQLERAAGKFEWYRDRGLTFHLGRDLQWRAPTARNRIYQQANWEQGRGLI